MVPGNPNVQKRELAVALVLSGGLNDLVAQNESMKMAFYLSIEFIDQDYFFQCIETSGILRRHQKQDFT